MREDATALAAAIATGQLSARSAMVAALEAAQRLGHLGAVTRVDANAGLAAADIADRCPMADRGPFHGVPFLGKDLGSAAAGLGPVAGSPAMARRVQDPIRDSALFARFRAAGLVPFGLTTAAEFGLALTSEPPLGPIARNPWDERRSPGGSSGGAAAVVAAGIVAMAHATDAAGSIRVPAACCGLVGLKPTRDAVPAGPSFDNHLMGLATELVLARSVRDVAAVFQAVCGSARLAADDGRGMQPRVALAIPDRVGPEQARAARNAAAVLEAAGCRMHERESPDDLGAEAARLARVVLTAALAESLKTLGPEDGEVSPLVAAVAAEGRRMPATDLFAAARDLARLGYECRRLFEDADMILSPVLSGAPPMVGHFDAGSNDPAARFAAMEDLAPNAVLANAAGIPALALPFGRDLDGLPLGVQLMAPAGADLALLKWGSRLEAGSPTLPFPYPIAGLT